jgi:hypothetical protein
MWVRLRLRPLHGYILLDCVFVRLVFLTRIHGLRADP